MNCSNHIAVGRGKLILFGEHVAVYGSPAVGVPLPCRTEIRRKAFSLKPSGQDDQLLLELMNTALSLTRESYKKNSWESEKLYQFSNVPRIGGFGSSAALCVAMSRFVLNRVSTGYNREVHHLANQLEKRFHGTPSGIDTGMAADTSVAAWVRNGTTLLPERRPLTIPEWYIVYGALPRTAPTSESVKRLQDLKQAGNAQVKTAMENLGRISSDFIEAVETCTKRHQTEMATPDKIRNGNFPVTAAELANQAQSILSSLHLSTDSIDTLLKLARDMGALGGKISGAGMGGAFYICAGNRENQNHIISTLPEKLFHLGIHLPVPLKTLDFGRVK